MRESIEFKNNYNKFFLVPMLFCVFIDFILTVGMYFMVGDLSFNKSFKIFSYAFLFSALLYKIPLIIIFLNHYFQNKGIEFSVIKENGEIDFELNLPKAKTTILYNDIMNIECYLSFPRFDQRMSWLFWDNYFYYKIVLNNGETIPISCLKCEKLFEHIPVDKRIRNKSFYPIIL